MRNTLLAMVLARAITISCAAVVASACVPRPQFECLESTPCEDGICESTGFCSFADESCASGQRYSDLASSDLRNQCTTPDVRIDASVIDVSLSSLGVSMGVLEPSFDSGLTSYSVDLDLGVQSLTVTPTATAPNDVSISVNGTTVDSGSASPTILLGLGENRIDVVVMANSGGIRTYAVTINRGAGILQQAYVKASNTDIDDVFGASVALSGDTLAVGASDEGSCATGTGGDGEADNGCGVAGAVYVFVRTAGMWSQQAYVKASNTDASDWFGEA